MGESAEPQPNANLTRAASAAALAAAGVAVLALAGWVFGVPGLTHVSEGQPGMNPLTAIAVLLGVFVLWGSRGPQVTGRRRAVALGCAATMATIGVLRLVHLASGLGPELDLMILPSRLAASPFPARIGSHTAFALACMGAALGTMHLRWRRAARLTDPLLFTALGTCILVLVGYAYAASSMHGLMSVNSACAMLLLGAGAVLVQPERGLMRMLLSRSPGGAMARRLLPTAALLPFVLGWLRLEGQRAGWYGLAMGTAMLAMTIVVLLVALIWMTGRSLDRAEQERRAIEAELRRSQERQHRLLESDMIGVLTANAEGWITEANAAFLRIIGYRAEELPLRTETITPPEWLGRTDTAKRELAEAGVATPFEKEYMRRDGRRVPVLVGAATIPGSGGEVMAFVVDLSGKREAEQGLEHMRIFLDSVVENLPSMVFVKDANDLRFVRLNRAGEQLLGFDRQALLGKNDFDFFPKEQAEFFTAKDRAVLADRLLLDIPEEEIRTSGGETRILHTKKVPILDRDGTPRYLLGISEDITARKHADQQLAALNASLSRRTAELEAANRELEAFSYSVSHDLRAPLRHIDGFADLLARHAGAMLDDKGRRHLEAISQSAKSMGELIDDLLAFSRMSRTELHHAPVDLDRLIEDVRRGLEGETRGRAIEWRIATLPMVHGDRAMLRLVFTNLLANAVKYSRPRAPAVIEVGSRETGDEVEVFVRDNGVGFDMKYAHKLFGVFQRLHSDQEFEGTGIGLANVRRVIQRHGGRTWAEGGIDTGATFHVALPQASAVGRPREAA